MTLVRPINTSLRLVIIVGLAVVMAAASFVSSFAVMMGITLAGVACGYIIFVIAGATLSLGRGKAGITELSGARNLSN